MQMDSIYYREKHVGVKEQMKHQMGRFVQNHSIHFIRLFP